MGCFQKTWHVFPLFSFFPSSSKLGGFAGSRDQRDSPRSIDYCWDWKKKEEVGKEEEDDDGDR